MEETRREMSLEKDYFGLSGPLHLRDIDWTNLSHRRSIAASLVQGVYSLEQDRQQNRKGPQALAFPWWDFFHFSLFKTLIDDKDLSIFGSVYEFKYPLDNNKSPADNPPRYVIAFCGTDTKPKTRSHDIKHDYHLMLNKIQKSPRFNIAMKKVQEISDKVGHQNIWLAGHSLGSAIALSIGKCMVKYSGSCIDTYLFNPPFASIPLQYIKCKKIKKGIRFANSLITAGVAVAVSGLLQKGESNTFDVLSEWIPFLFVNPSDPICSEYMAYFEHRLKMLAIGDGRMGRIAAQNSIGSLLSGKISDADHLLASAWLGINMSPTDNFRKAHGLCQWWNPNIRCEFKLHQYK